MSKIFISYRREDSRDSAGRLKDHLARHFGEKNIFFDVEGIPPGVDFVNTIQRRLSTCDALIAVIGKNWVKVTDVSGRPRLENKDDYVRYEIAMALKQGTPVFPVLVGDAKMPSVSNLPDLLKPLSRKHALDIRFNTFKQDVNRLIAVIQNQLKGRTAVEGKSARNRGLAQIRFPRVQDIDSTLRKLLLVEKPKLCSAIQLTHAAPDEQFPPQSVTIPAVSIFLSSILECKREGDWEETDLLLVEYSYIVTAWPSSSLPDPVTEEHKLLSEVGEVFGRNSRIPSWALQGELQSDSHPFYNLRIRAGNLQDISQLRSSLFIADKTCLAYRVSVSIGSADENSTIR
jgi:hypothetical protein